MKELESVFTGSRTIYSLSEAATLVGLSVDDLLHYGWQRRLMILTCVPDNVFIYCTNQDLLELADPTLQGPMRRMKEAHLNRIHPIVRQDIKLLVLSAADCGLVASHGEAKQAIFLTGVTFGSAGEAVIVEPPSLGAPEGYFDIRPLRRFACYSSEGNSRGQAALKYTVPTKVRLTAEVLRIRNDDLASLKIERVATKGSAKFDNGFVKEPHMSERLISLNRAAWHFWDCSRPDWSPPSSREVEDWFCSECKFPVKLAKGAAQILRQSYKDWNQKEYEAKKANNEINMFDAILLVSARWRNADLGCGDRADQIDTYPEQGETMGFLKNTFGFADHTALVAWRIAKPEKAKVLGRPKNCD